jgi:DNA uptake protein ComE-like DNA-binding protein
MKYFTTSDRKGVLLLSILIIVIQFLYFFVDFDQKNINIDKKEINLFQKEIDSLKNIELESQKPKIYPFNPSFITDYKGYKLGMSTEEIDKLLAYRKLGKYINSVEEFQRVTGVSDSLLAIISPHFKFPDWVVKKNKKEKVRKENSKNKKKTSKNSQNILLTDFEKDINKANSEDLQKIRGVGEKLAKRIIKYRKKLTAYSYNSQLYEVWYLDKEVADRILKHFKVLSKPKINKLNINTASFKEVLHLPYIDYKLTKKIFEYRDEMAEIQSLKELKKIDSFPIDKFDRISLYLKAE